MMMINGAQPWIPDEDRLAILEEIDGILKSGQFTQGPHVRAFEASCAGMAGTVHAIAVNSGGTALELLLEGIDVAGGDVVVPTETFIATANAVVRAGATPVFADVDPNTLSLTAADVAARLTSRTKAVILVHMFGLMSPEIPALRSLCAERGIPLLEDAAHAHGASFGGLRAGGLGLAGCFSFYATKVLTTGEGGVITTDDDNLANRLRSLRDHGRGCDGAFDMAGNNFRLPEIAAVIGLSQQRRLSENIAHRRGVAASYRRALGGVKGLTLVDPVPEDGHVYWRYAALLDEGIDRLDVQRRMAARFGVRITWMYEPLCHHQPFYAARPEGHVVLPGAESACGRQINLPTHPGVGEADAQRVIEGLLTVLQGGA